MKGAPSPVRDCRGQGRCGWAQGDGGVGWGTAGAVPTDPGRSSDYNYLHLLYGFWGRRPGLRNGMALVWVMAPPRFGAVREGHKLDERRERAESSGSGPPAVPGEGEAESLRSGLGAATRAAGAGPRRGVELLAGRAVAAGPGAPWGSEGCEADSGREARLRRRAGSAGPARGAAGEPGAPPKGEVRGALGLAGTPGGLAAGAGPGEAAAVATVGAGPGGRRRTRRGEPSASGPTSGRATCGQKLMATACCSVAMAEVPCGGGGGGGKRPTRWPNSACCTISRSYLTISWMMAFSWLLNTPELRSCCTLCSRIEFFLPGGGAGGGCQRCRFCTAGMPWRLLQPAGQCPSAWCAQRAGIGP